MQNQTNTSSTGQNFLGNNYGSTTNMSVNDPMAMANVQDIMGNASALFHQPADADWQSGIGMQEGNAIQLQPYSTFPFFNLMNSFAQNQYVNTQQGQANALNRLGDLSSLNPTLGDTGINNPYNEGQQWAESQYNTPWAAENNLSGLAQNTSGALTPAQQAILDQNAERQSNRLASLYSGSGRTGSFGAGIGMARGIAEQNNPLIAGFNQQNIQNALNANQMLTSTQATRQGQAFGGLNNAASGRLGATTAYGNMGNTMQSQMLQANEALPAAMQAAFMPGQAMQQAGAAQMSLPWEQLRNYASTMGSMYPFLDRTQTTQGYTNGFGINNQQGVSSQPTPWTQFAGLGFSGLGMLGGLSDREDKTDVKKLGTHGPSGLPIYAFRYKGDPKHYPKMVGPMAQDVAKKFPGAVTRIAGHMAIRGGGPGPIRGTGRVPHTPMGVPDINPVGGSRRTPWTIGA